MVFFKVKSGGGQSGGVRRAVNGYLIFKFFQLIEETGCQLFFLGANRFDRLLQNMGYTGVTTFCGLGNDVAA